LQGLRIIRLGLYIVNQRKRLNKAERGTPKAHTKKCRGCDTPAVSLDNQGSSSPAVSLDNAWPINRPYYCFSGVAKAPSLPWQPCRPSWTLTTPFPKNNHPWSPLRPIYRPASLPPEEEPSMAHPQPSWLHHSNLTLFGRTRPPTSLALFGPQAAIVHGCTGAAKATDGRKRPPTP